MDDDKGHPDSKDLIRDRSPFNQRVGYRLVEWRDDYALVELDVRDDHMNRRGAVHGGVLMTAIDAAGGYCGTFCPYPGRTRMCVTVSLTTEFLRPAGHDERLAITARRRGGGRGLFAASIEVHDQHDHLIALGHGIYRYVRGSGAPDGIPGADSTERDDDA
ncbi:MAG: PaaI family thioesterase [Alphaproteobacteria bacterium]|nr:PaaI family thioesterase [Alphaproteobacteria bacterium]